MASPTVTVTDEDLRAAWLAVRQPSWPSTLEEVLQDPTRAPAVRGYASTLARRRCRTASPTRPDQRCAPAPPRTPFTPPVAGWVDHKRAAAGDLDDD